MNFFQSLGGKQISGVPSIIKAKCLNLQFGKLLLGSIAKNCSEVNGKPSRNYQEVQIQDTCSSSVSLPQRSFHFTLSVITYLFQTPAICEPFACLPLPLLCSVCDWLCSEAPFPFSACQTLSYLMFLQATRYPSTFSPAISRLDLRRLVWVMCFNRGTEFNSAAPSGSCSLRLKTQDSLTQFIVYIAFCNKTVSLLCIYQYHHNIIRLCVPKLTKHAVWCGKFNVRAGLLLDQ